MLLVTQALSLAQSLALAILTFAGVITVAEILALQVFQGVINAFDTPARQAFVVTMIEDRADLPNAIALNSSMVNASRIAGPAIGGILIASFGEAWCFLADAISYVAVIASLLAMRIGVEERKPSTSRLMEELATGFRYVRDFEPIRTVLLLLALVSMMGMPYAVLMPAFASKILHGGPHTLGILMGMSGVGALVGAIYLAARRSVLGLGRVIATSVTVFGIALIGFALSRTLWLSIALLPLVGAGFMVALASSNTVLQTIVEEHLRGRVMAFYAMSFLGTAPIGSLFAGVLAEHVGEPATVIIGGAACIVGGLWFRSRLARIRELVRPIYVERGILPASSAV